MVRNIILEETTATWKFKDGLKGLSGIERATMINLIRLAGIGVHENEYEYNKTNNNTIYLKIRSDKTIDVPKRTLELCKIVSKLQKTALLVREMGDEFRGEVKK
jgi:hypothetical protein